MCDGDWEHGQGVKIGTLDNPGWLLEISLQGTSLEHATFNEFTYGVFGHDQTNGDDWLTCKVEQMHFKGFGGPLKLEEMIRVFLDWASGNGEQDAAPNAGGADAPPASVS